MDQKKITSVAGWADDVLKTCTRYLNDVSGEIVCSICDRPSVEDLETTDRWYNYELLLLEIYVEADISVIEASKRPLPPDWNEVLKAVRTACAVRGDAPHTFDGTPYATALECVPTLCRKLSHGRPEWQNSIGEAPARSDDLLTSQLVVEGQRYLQRLVQRRMCLSSLEAMRIRVRSELSLLARAVPTARARPREQGAYGAILEALRRRGPLDGQALIDTTGRSNLKPVLAALVEMGDLEHDGRHGYRLPEQSTP
ncbi:MAG TPA: hypothetical protein VGN72_09605 [Tepidisphaeraceae bacterium]|jgi:hypothetical protein|nr:hypothetical protein [Tepidisphaeraceae bacterium]